MCTESRDTHGLKRQRVEYRFIGILLGAFCMPSILVFAAGGWWHPFRDEKTKPENGKLFLPKVIKTFDPKPSYSKPYIRSSTSKG